MDTATSYTCPMHPEVQQDHPGECPKCGMALEVMHAKAADEEEHTELNVMTRRFWIGAALSLPVFLLAMAHMIPALDRQPWATSDVSRWVQFVLATPVVWWAGWPFFKRGWRSILTMNIISSSAALALSIWSPVQAQTTEPAHGTMMTESNMMQRCQMMKEKKAKMMEQMMTQDPELTARVVKMNGAPEEKNTDMMAAIVTQMVTQRSASNTRKAKMQDAMMQQMQMGNESMSQCPMMKGAKGMKGMKKMAATAHKEDQAGMTDTHKAHHAERK